MSLLDDFARSCVLMEKKREPDGAGGYIVEWTEGAEFTNYQAMDTSMEARRAEKEGVTSLYSALVEKAVPIEYNDVFKDKSTGETYRVTSNPEDKQAPRSSMLPLKYFTAERWALTT
nr:MAG TPA: head closure knob [Caudoviricetes sp.]